MWKASRRNKQLVGFINSDETNQSPEQWFRELLHLLRDVPQPKHAVKTIEQAGGMNWKGWKTDQRERWWGVLLLHAVVKAYTCLWPDWWRPTHPTVCPDCGKTTGPYRLGPAVLFTVERWLQDPTAENWHACRDQGCQDSPWSELKISTYAIGMECARGWMTSALKGTLGRPWSPDYRAVIRETLTPYLT